MFLRFLRCIVWYYGLNQLKIDIQVKKCASQLHCPNIHIWRECFQIPLWPVTQCCKITKYLLIKEMFFFYSIQEIELKARLDTALALTEWRLPFIHCHGWSLQHPPAASAATPSSPPGPSTGPSLSGPPARGAPWRAQSPASATRCQATTAAGLQAAGHPLPAVTRSLET